MKKLFTLLTLLLCVASSAWADETIGITNTTSETSGEATTETLTGSGTDVTVQKLALSSDTEALSEYTKGDKAMQDGSSTNVYSTHAYKWNKNIGTSIDLTNYPNEYVGFSFTVAEGKTFSVSGLKARLAGSANFIFRVVIEDSNGNTLYKSSDMTISRTSNNKLEVSNITNSKVQDLPAGTYYVKAHIMFNSTGKYFVFRQLQLTGTVETVTIDTESPSITTDLSSSYNAFVGSALSLSIVAAHADSYQWYSNTSASNDGGTAIEGATSASYNYTPADADINTTKYFYCVATNSNATGNKSATSNVATVTVGKSTLIGLQQINDGVATGDYLGTLAAPTYTTIDHLTVTKANGSGCGDNFSGRATANGNYYVEKTFRKTTTLTTWDNDTWVGYTVTVASGYKLSLSNLKASLWDCANTDFHWRVVVENESGTALYTSSEKTSTKTSDGSVSVASPTGLSDLLEGTYTVKIQIYQNGGNKYFAIPSLTFNAEVEENQAAKYAVTTSVSDASMGSVTETAEYIEGTDAEITATPNTGYKFIKWVIDEGTADEAESTDNPYTFTSISAAHTAKAYFGASKKVDYSVTEAINGTRTDNFATEYADDNDKFTIPAANRYLSSDNQTLTGWIDGNNNSYTPGQEITLTEDIVLSPVFANNDGETLAATLEATDNAVSAMWDFSASAVSFNVEQKTAFYVQQATIKSKTVDIPMAIDATSGKVNNVGRTDAWAQTNSGTKFTVPVVKGSTITMVGFSEFKTEAWETEKNNVVVTNQPTKFNGSPLTEANLSSDKKTATYEYGGEAGTLVIEVGADISYTSTITVTYPVMKTKYEAPTITVGDFNFENKGYEVKITATEGELQVSTDGTTYAAKTSPYTIYATTTTTYYAKATGADYDASDVAEKEVTNTFDAQKKYVAWVMQDGYKSAWKESDDAIYQGLASEYNVVTCSTKDNSKAYSVEFPTLGSADLVVVTELMTGNKTFSNGLKDLVGNVPMIGLKFFNYTSGRWGWGAPSNNDKSIRAIRPLSKGYKVLDGVTFDGDDVALFGGSVSENHIQTYASITLDGNVNMATVAKNADAGYAMHASNVKKYFGLGLSCDDFANYNDNAVTIIKNAAAMLIAGDDLTEIVGPADPTETDNSVVLTTTANMAGWRSFYDAENSYTVDANTKVYVVTGLNEGKVTLTEFADGVPAGVPVILKTSADAEADGTFKMTLTKASETIVFSGENMLKVTPYQDNAYRLGYKAGENNGVGFYPFNPTTAAAGIVVLPTSSGAARLGIEFADGGTTGVSSVTDNVNLNKVVFDLQGRRVAQPAKGLYIVNGKKVVIK